MDFAIGWLIIVPIIGIIIAGSMAADAGFFQTLITVIVVVNAFSVGITWAMTPETRQERYVGTTTCDVAKSMGLEPGREYPVNVGSNIDGSYGGGHFQSGLFGGAGSFDIRAGRGVLVEFKPSGKEGAFLTLPTGLMRPFDAPSGSQPTIAIHLVCRPVSATQTVHYSAPRFTLDSGVLFFNSHEVSRDTPVIDDTNLLTHGLSPIVNEGLDSVEIHLSPEDKAKILG